MKITFERSMLIEVVDKSMCAVSDRNSVPVIQGIRLRTEKNGKCSITTFDLEKGFYTEVDCRIEEQGNFVINAAKFFRIIKALPDLYVTVDINDKCAVTLTSGKAKFELHAMQGDTFPNTPAFKGDRGFIIESEALKKLIAQTSFAIGSGGDARPSLCGANFTVKGDRLKIAACDGNRLAVRERTCKLVNKNNDGSELDLEFIIPGKTIAQLTKLIADNETVTVILARKHVIFKLEEIVFFSRIIDQKYIDYERVVPKGRETVVHISREELAASLERATLVTEDRSFGQPKTYVKASFEGDVLDLNSVSVNGSVYDEIEIKKEGSDVAVGVNCRFLLDAMRAADTDIVELVLNGQLTSIKILPVYDEKKENKGDEDFLYMVSPVRMK